MGNSAVLLAATLAALGCPRAGDRLPARTTTLPTQPVETAPAPPPPAPPPPSEADLAIDGALRAEARGDHLVAIDLLRRAAEQTHDEQRLADIHYSLAMIEADPNNPERNLEESRIELQRFFGAVVTHPRLREARVTAALMDEATQMKIDSAALKADLDLKKSEVALLSAKLDEKEKELAGIKKVLLQNKTKP